MADLKCEPVAHEHEAFLRKAFKRKGFAEAYEVLETSTSSPGSCSRRDAEPDSPKRR